MSLIGFIIFTILYLLSIYIFMKLIFAPEHMIQAGIEQEEMQNKLESGSKDLTNAQLAFLLAHQHSIRMTVFVIEKKIIVGVLGIVGAIFLSKLVDIYFQI